MCICTADNGMTSRGEQHPAHMRSISPVLTEIGFSFMPLTHSAVVFMANLEAACLLFNLWGTCYSSYIQYRVLYL